ncbi:hypothetical protein BDW62DRAFT_81683 [Aspergillus aurantiobrunneus]
MQRHEKVSYSYALTSPTQAGKRSLPAHLPFNRAPSPDSRHTIINKPRASHPPVFRTRSRIPTQYSEAVEDGSFPQPEYYHETLGEVLSDHPPHIIVISNEHAGQYTCFLLGTHYPTGQTLFMLHNDMILHYSVSRVYDDPDTGQDAYPSRRYCICQPPSPRPISSLIP